ncbi:MAG: hypothetical protein K0R20_163 [Actinomycetia bacterium]|jgi:hypothetical protein|nr:hypothetical protein [Actinomycetes bacterium]
MIFGTPGETAAAFEKLKYVALYRGPFGEAKPLLEKLRSAEQHNKLEIPPRSLCVEAGSLASATVNATALGLWPI